MIKVINIVPQVLSGETNQDSEPNIAVNPANPVQIAASAFTPDPLGGSNAPIYVSVDGGDTWTLNSIVPSNGSVGTGDITLKFAGTSSRLFTSILDGGSGAFEVHRTSDFTNPAPMAVLESRNNEDQPYVQAASVMGGADGGKDRIFIGVNDFNAPAGKTATVEQTLDAGIAAPVFSSIRVEKRTTLGQNGPQVRPAVHPDGTIYAAFYRWIASSGSWPGNTLVITDAELIVVRDDNWGTGASPFTALTDTSDGLAGRRAATGLSFPFNSSGVAAMGQERWGGDISIAVDPRNSSTVYVAFSTRVSGTYTLQVIRSVDRGATWSATLLSASNAKNPAIAINSLGKIAIVYQQLSGTGATQRWETHYRDTIDASAWTDTILCSVPSQSPLRAFSPYIGDYIHMMAAGKDFYGIFSANNTPDLMNFPQGVTFQRNHDFAAKKLFALDGVTEVQPSIDPFFFKITEIDGNLNSDFYVRDWTNSAADHDTGLEPSTHPVFFTQSDVWNQRANVAPIFVSDQPQNEDPQNDATNFAFARISRNITTTAETVNVDFYVAEFGTGSPYNLVASTTVSFAAGENSKIASASWTLPATSSVHLCLAVQISTAADPFVAPGLNGNTPGWPTTDNMVINDNNKGQRNMSVHYGLAGAGASFYGIIRNASKKVRDFELKINVNEKVISLYKNPMILIQNSQPVPLKPGKSISIKDMRPGEYRWVCFQMNSFKDVKTGTSMPVDLLEVVDGKVINGCRIDVVSATPGVALKNLLNYSLSVFRRIEKTFELADATEIIKSTKKTLKADKLTGPVYLSLLALISNQISAVVKQFGKATKKDIGLNLGPSLESLLKNTTAKKSEMAYGDYMTLLNKLDVALTLFQLTSLKFKKTNVKQPGKRNT